MDFDDLLGPQPSIIELRAENRWDAIEELIGHLVATHKIATEQRDAIARSVRQRESAMSTGVGFSIGLPHAVTELISEVAGAVGRSRRGIQFDALDGKPVHLVLLFLVPTGQFQKHVDTLAKIAKLLHRDDFRDGLWRRFM